MRRLVLIFAAGVVWAALSGCGGISMAQSRPPPVRPIKDIAREEAAEVITVNDTRLDLSTGRGRAMTAHAPAIPVGPIGVRVPVSVGGEKKMDVPAEEITVRLLADGKLVSTVQELSSPPFAPGERVRVIYEKSEDNSKGRVQIVR